MRWFLLAAGVGAAYWYFTRKPAARPSNGPYVPAPPVNPACDPWNSNVPRYAWRDGADSTVKCGSDWCCWDHCENKRVDDAVCELY